MKKMSDVGQNRMEVSFSFNPNLVQKVKSINGYNWHSEGK